eukprot:9109812-Pyramimonas_sp.AAC.1
MNVGDELYVEYDLPGAPLLHARVVIGVSEIEGLHAAVVVSPDHDLFIEWFSEGNDDTRHRRRSRAQGARLRRASLACGATGHLAAGQGAPCWRHDADLAVSAARLAAGGDGALVAAGGAGAAGAGAG